MANLDSFYVRWTPRLLSVLRIIAGFLFIAHGAQKLFGFLAPAGAPSAPLMSMIGVAGALEFVGGLLLLVGLFTRPVAFILSGLMAVAYFMAHAPQGFWPLQNKGELAVLYCFVFLFFAVAGGGEWSLDRLLRRDAPAARNYA
jgi:putative oxidoreductase